MGKEAGAKRLEEGLPGKEPHVGDVTTVGGEARTWARSGVEEFRRPTTEEDLERARAWRGEKIRNDHEARGVEAGPKRAELEKGARAPMSRASARRGAQGHLGVGSSRRVSRNGRLSD